MSKTGVAIVCITAVLAFGLGHLTGGPGLASATPSWQELLEERDPLRRMAGFSRALETLDAGFSLGPSVAHALEQHAARRGHVRLGVQRRPRGCADPGGPG
jgi:hypothetical protein